MCLFVILENSISCKFKPLRKNISMYAYNKVDMQK